MTARILPPSDLIPIRDLVLHARRNLTRGLILSGLAHLVVLAAFVTLQHREPMLRTVPGTVNLVPNPPTFTPPPRVPHRGQTIPDVAHPILVPTTVPIVAPPLELPVPEGVGDLREGPMAGSPGTDTQVPAGQEPWSLDPPEGSFVYFDETPVPLRRVQPEYPAWARENGIAGTVLLHVLVGQDGRVRAVSVIRGVTGLTEEAREALRRWTFRPATAYGRPVAVWVEIPVQFRLGG
jgi:periplasmic protein TonB